MKKVKRTIPAWASISGSKKVPVTNFSGTQHKVDDILIEAIMVRKARSLLPQQHVDSRWPEGENASDCVALSLQSCDDRGGVSYQSLLKYIGKKYPGMEIEKKKFLIKKAMKKHLEKGTIKQVEDARQQGRGKLLAAPRIDSRVAAGFAKPSNMSYSVLSVHQLKGKGLSGTFAIRNKPVLSKVSWSSANAASAAAGW